MALASPSPLKVVAGLVVLSLLLLCFCDPREWQYSTSSLPQDTQAPDPAAAASPGILAPIMALLRFLSSLLLATTALTRPTSGLPPGTSTPLPSYPLAVKSPYLSTWLPGHSANNTARAQPEFWTGQNLSWPIVARVDGRAYALFGDPGASVEHAATTEGVAFTSTHTYVELSAGGVGFVLDFFTPVFPGEGEYARQSLPYSYLTVSAHVASEEGAGGEKRVQVLSGIDQTWTAQEGRAGIGFERSTAAAAAARAGLFTFFNPEARFFTEKGDMATWGSVVFASSVGKGVSQTCGEHDAVFASFAENGVLVSSNSCNGTDLVAIAHDLGSVGGNKSNSNSKRKRGDAGAAPASATFVVGLQRDYAIDYLGEPQTGYHRSRWPTIPQAVDYVLESYASALEHSRSFDTLIRSKAEGVSDDYGREYADIVEASVRQTFATMDITVPLNDTTTTTTTPSIFLKEISSDGNLNTLDLIFQTYPIFIALNPAYIRLLLSPILAYLAASPPRWPHPWVIHDMGARYPNATGHDAGAAEQMPLFETSALMILLLASRTFSSSSSSSGTDTAEYTPLVQGYADWLASPEASALYPPSQLISVDAVGPRANQTGLAVQSAIGLKAAAVLLGGEQRYEALATQWVNELWYRGLGLDGTGPGDSKHFTYYYGQNETWNVLFPAFSDVLLNLSTFPVEAWTMQGRWYGESISEMGLAWSDSVNWGLLDWNIVAAAATPSSESEEVAKKVVQTSHAFLTNGKHWEPFGTRYFVRGPREGQWLSNKARPTVGSCFALLAVREGRIYYA